VKSGRAKREVNDESMQGQDFFGRQAVALNLADGFGDMTTAINMAMTLGG
jgi:ClpP class serine protease